MGRELLSQYVDLPGGSLMSPLGSDILDPSKFPADLITILRDGDGKIYSVPLDIHRTNVLWYNKSVLAAHGISHPPATWAEFKTDAITLKAAGITPLAVGDSGIWAFGMIFETALIAELGASDFDGLWTGATDWGDARVTAALRDAKMALGFANADHPTLSWDQAADMLITGQAAMTIMGDWANREFLNMDFSGYGWAPAPGNTGIYQALADSFTLPRKAPDPAGARTFLAYLATAEAEDIFNPWKGAIPPRLDAGNPPAGQQQYTDYQKWAITKWQNPATRIVPSMEHGAAAAPAWSSAINDILTMFAMNKNVATAQAALVAAATGFVAP